MPSSVPEAHDLPQKPMSWGDGNGARNHRWRAPIAVQPASTSGRHPGAEQAQAMKQSISTHDLRARHVLGLSIAAARIKSIGVALISVRGLWRAGALGGSRSAGARFRTPVALRRKIAIG